MRNTRNWKHTTKARKQYYVNCEDKYEVWDKMGGQTYRGRTADKLRSKRNTEFMSMEDPEDVFEACA